MDDEIKRLRHSKDENDRKKAIGLLKIYLAENPNSAEAWYALAGCHDFIGEEKEAEPCYQQVYEIGWKNLSVKEQKSFFVGYGSTLRNNFHFERSAEILKEALLHFPDYPALKFFLAFTYYSLKEDRSAAQLLFQAGVETQKYGLDGYERAIAWYTENLETHPEVRK